MFHQSLHDAWVFRQANTETWQPAHVPGGVHTDLLALGAIPDPFVGDNEKKVQWIGETDWEYRLIFTPEPGVLNNARQFLVCDGLDTLADIRLNGKLLGKADNMFRQWSWTVTGDLQAGENELFILFHAPLTYIRARQAVKPLTGGGDIPGGPHLRKASYQWGWDWGPKLPPIGIWKDIRLESFSQARFDDIHVRQIHRAGEVVVSINTKIERWKDQDRANGPLFVAAELTCPDGTVLNTITGVTRGRAVCALDVPDPQLWWPNEYGPQPLYNLEVTLQSETAILDQCAYQVGLRTSGQGQEPDNWGESFTFVVNGIPVFAKGSDWIPADSFPTRLTEPMLDSLFRSAVTAHMNMIRVWGGGFYESETFYDLCDRYGILVWQDFAFACGQYPEDDAYAANVRQEALENVRRLRHRAGLALWCGNNEMEQGWADWGWNKPADFANQSLKAGYDRMYHHLLPAVVAAEDPDHVYWPSSASSGIPFAQPNGDQRGDMHYWEVWHGRKPFTAYRTQYPRFMSEFGFQALPTYKTIQAFADEKDQNMTSYVMEHHQRSGPGNGLMIFQMTETFRMPKSFPALVYLSMILQAEGIRYGVEHWRRNCHRVSGTLIWQLNDCWPVASWSSLDYFGRWKALHYAARRFYAPVLLSIEDVGARMGVHVTSDLTKPWSGRIGWRLESLSGEVLKAGENSVEAAALADTPVVEFDFADLISDANCRSTVFVAELWHEEQLMTRSLGFFAPSKHLELSAPGIIVEPALDGSVLQIALQSASLARFVELSLDGADAVFSDNYFDLPAGCSIIITTECPPGWSLEQARQALKVVSLFDSF